MPVDARNSLSHAVFAAAVALTACGGSDSGNAVADASASKGTAPVAGSAPAGSTGSTGSADSMGAAGSTGAAPAGSTPAYTGISNGTGVDTTDTSGTDPAAPAASAGSTGTSAASAGSGSASPPLSTGSGRLQTVK